MLCLVVAFLLFCDPLMPLSVSFWLSVGAVTCLIVWYRYVPLSIIEWRHQKLSRKVRWILGLFHLQLGLLILFTPIQLFFFNGLALNGFLANLIAVPLYSFLLVPLILFAVLTQGAFLLGIFQIRLLKVLHNAYVFSKARICRFRLIYLSF